MVFLLGEYGLLYGFFFMCAYKELVFILYKYQWKNWNLLDKRYIGTHLASNMLGIFRCVR